jgi:hypothetical protein
LSHGQSLPFTLSKETKYLNGTYTQYFNRQHQRVGHVFQGRFKAILVQKNAYLLELARYICLNPVQAQMVRSVKAWCWISYRATAGYEKNAACLTTECILAGITGQYENLDVRKPLLYRARLSVYEKNVFSTWTGYLRID